MKMERKMQQLFGVTVSISMQQQIIWYSKQNTLFGVLNSNTLFGARSSNRLFGVQTATHYLMF